MPRTDGGGVMVSFVGTWELSRACCCILKDYQFISLIIIKKKEVEVDNCSGKWGDKRWQLQPFVRLDALSLSLISPGVIWHPHHLQPNISGLLWAILSAASPRLQKIRERVVHQSLLKRLACSAVSSHCEPIPNVIEIKWLSWEVRACSLLNSAPRWC